MAKSKDPDFKSLTPHERKILGVDGPPQPRKDANQAHADRLTKGMDQKKLERELKKLT